ncbi:vomeronasal type-2 receptor 26-like [Pseudophryne corroboree]|uniref:vomeronasal type-2 receptor 26-like n=1 Tax=Pseudophryne corroboree TaxID=495146 RepID=UPI003081B426
MTKIPYYMNSGDRGIVRRPEQMGNNLGFGQEASENKSRKGSRSGLQILENSKSSGPKTINYGATDPVLNDRQLYPTFSRIVPDDQDRYAAIVKCLLHFGWNWVGVITPSNDSGDMELLELSKLMSQHGICIEYIIKLSINTRINRRKLQEMKQFTARIIVICGLGSIYFAYFIYENQAINEDVTVILSDAWTNVKYFNGIYFPPINCSLIFILPPKKIPNINNFILNVNPFERPDDPILEDIWLLCHHCLSQNIFKNKLYQLMYNVSGHNCSRKSYIPEKFYGVAQSKPHYTYMSVYALAHALNRMNLHKNKDKSFELKQTRLSMRNLHYTDPTGEEMTFNERGDLPSKWSVANCVIYKTNTSYKLVIKPVTTFEESEDDQVSNIKAGEITWRNGMDVSFHEQITKSRCNDRCPPGYRKAFNGGFHVCCYDCVPCSEGEISNTTDSEICHRCPDEEWPDERRVRCVPKIYDFLSYEKDLVVQISAVTSLSFSAITLFILGNFIYYWDTPIVKANNRAVSFILLVSILLSFLCVFLFLGRPVDITCRLRQTSFGIFFSTALSSVLAKTVTVFIAFKATKPGSSWRKWVTLKVSKHVVIVFSSLQALICGIWLTVSSPYQEYDHHSYKGMIIIQCNEGSVLWLYSMLGYMGILASVNFILAFMVRTLPDSFNEAKYITFSMLVFCSVWIAMIPAYLSTKGKYMVAVEIFAILTSCAGVLGCIFFPKLYILLIKPEFNSRKTILGKNST